MRSDSHHSDIEEASESQDSHVDTWISLEGKEINSDTTPIIILVPRGADATVVREIFRERLELDEASSRDLGLMIDGNYLGATKKSNVDLVLPSRRAR